MKNILNKLLNNGVSAKYNLFNKWKNLPDVKSTDMDNAANKLE